MEKKIEQFIDSQKSLSQDMLKKCHDIKTFYWGNSQPSEWSLCPVPRAKNKIEYLRIQLLQTPKLIVDVPPIPENKFEKTFGFNYEQFSKLVEIGYITPNMYHYQNSTWKDYADSKICSRSLTNLLVQHGRINNIWVDSYLNKQNFSDKFQTLTEKYKSFNVNGIIQNNLSTKHPCYPTNNLNWNTFCELTARRHALLDILSEDNQWEELFEKIFTSFRSQNQGDIFKTLEILDVAKVWSTDPIIRCFGGIQTLNSIDFKNILKNQRILDIGVTNIANQDNRNQFINQLMNSVNTNIFSGSNLMNESQFNAYLEILKELNGKGFGYLLDFLETSEKDNEKWWSIIDRLEHESLREFLFLYKIRNMLKSLDVEVASGDDSPTDILAILKNFSKILSAGIDQWMLQSRRPAGPIRRIITPHHIRIEWERVGDVLSPDKPIRRRFKF